MAAFSFFVVMSPDAFAVFIASFVRTKLWQSASRQSLVQSVQ